LQKVADNRQQGGRRGELVARRLNVAVKHDNLVLKLAIPPQAEGVAIGIQEVRQALELRPLLLVVLVREAARIGTLAGRFDLDEAD
jgi:hypothetical protein